MIIGRSTHSPAQADAAGAEPGVDYFCAGPTWATPTKPGRPAAGLSLLAHVAAAAPARPWFAIGGIESLERLDEVIAAGRAAGGRGAGDHRGRRPGRRGPRRSPARLG